MYVLRSKPNHTPLKYMCLFKTRNQIRLASHSACPSVRFKCTFVFGGHHARHLNKLLEQNDDMYMEHAQDVHKTQGRRHIYHVLRGQ